MKGKLTMNVTLNSKAECALNMANALLGGMSVSANGANGAIGTVPGWESSSQSGSQRGSERGLMSEI